MGEKINKTIKNLDKVLAPGVEWGSRKRRKAHINLRKWLKELKKYRKLEKQGRLFRLPCKVGDTTYFLKKCESCGEWRINERIVSSVLISEGGLLLFEFKNVCGRMRFEEFGRIVFLTRQEAEEELAWKEREEVKA